MTHPVPNSIQQLAYLAQQMQQGGDYLPPFQDLLTDENINYVRESAHEAFNTLSNMMQTCMTSVGPDGTAPNPLECQHARHDMRNLVAVVRGFSELMLMDVPEGHQIAPILEHLRNISDQFVSILDTIKDEVENRAEQTAIFAS